MRLADGLIELDAKAGLLGRNDVAVLPFDLLLEQLFVKAIPLLERFQDQEIRQRQDPTRG